jgi:serine phosphatase RsbU (regulator of sigma subunit)
MMNPEIGNSALCKSGQSPEEAIYGEPMQDLAERITEALAKEEARAELFASYVRLVLLVVLTTIALVNAPSLMFAANVFNFSALLICYAYGLIVLVRLRGRGYHRAMKYITSCLDIVLVILLLLLYTKIEIPSVALKNYVFLVVFPLIAVTAFRYDRMLTLVSGGVAVGLYLALVLYLTLSGSVALTDGGYERELFTSQVTYIGQVTKILILIVYILLVSHLAQYSRKLFHKLVADELSLRDQQEQTEWELKLASQVQAQFLPRSLPVISGLEMHGLVQQGKFIGGDYYDFIQLAADRLLVVSADVSGKGVPAALIMAEVRGSTQLLASMQLGLEDLLQRLNTLVYHSTEKKSFVTFSAVTVDTTFDLLTYVNAGHPRPLLCSGGVVRPLLKGTVPLGICPELPQLTTNTEEFPSGSVLLSYTDGVVEQRDAHAEEYGDARLREFVRTHALLCADAFAQTLVQEVKDFGGGKALEDDMSIAVVKKQ